jgi:tRNA nucleotidyltransferase (CCA-adding enzyme)
LKEEGRRKKEEGRRKKEEGRRKKEEGRENFLFEVTNKENS